MNRRHFTKNGIVKHDSMEKFGFTLAEAAVHTALSNNKSKAAFTLAEVLITLGIIGVVVAITIPTLINKYNQTVAETRLKQFYSEINQAVQLSELDNGDKRGWNFWDGACRGNDGYSKECLEHNFNKFFKPYLRYTNIEYYVGDTSADFPCLIVYFSNGSAMRVRYGAQDVMFYPVGSHVKDKNHKIANKDYFFFAMYPSGAKGARNKYFINKGFEPYIGVDWQGSDDDLSCLKRTQMNGWKFPDDCNPWK